jgi:hypothetical protein
MYDQELAFGTQKEPPQRNKTNDPILKTMRRFEQALHKGRYTSGR